MSIGPNSRRIRAGDVIVIACGIALIGLLYVDAWATSSVTSLNGGTTKGYDAWATFTGPALRIALGLIVASVALVVVRIVADIPRKPFGNTYVASTAATLGLFLLTTAFGPDTSGTGTTAGVSIEIERGMAMYVSVLLSAAMFVGALMSAATKTRPRRVVTTSAASRRG